MMRYYLIFLLLLTACGQKNKNLPQTAQEIIDRAIENAGGELYKSSNISFEFRDRTYVMRQTGNKKVLLRITRTMDSVITDIKEGSHFQRIINDSVVQLADSMAVKYANSINAVHYFAYLPYGLNDPAVNKELLGESVVNGKEYYKVKITFDRENGGDDFDDVYIYWFSKQSFSPDYLAYEFHVDGGGMRFRTAFNERIVNGIRFVDYKNYSPQSGTSLYDIENLFEANKLEFLSEIKLSNIQVTR